MGTEGVGLGIVGRSSDVVDVFLVMCDGSSTLSSMALSASSARTSGSSVSLDTCPVAATLDVAAVAFESRPYDEVRPKLAFRGCVYPAWDDAFSIFGASM